jgi:diacylglycerol kinase family enzyme
MRTQRLLLINPHSGRSGSDADALAAAARERGIEAQLLRRGDDPAEVARAAAPAVLGVAGGDGSLAPLAEVAIDLDAAFVCIPFGTRNHFARDAGLELDPLEALGAFDGIERRIDVGRIDGRVFLNNVSLGAYAGLVHERERHRRRGEALARLRAFGVLARGRGALHARVNGEEIVTRVLLVGNNRYEPSVFTLGARERLDAGVLHLWSAGRLLPRTWSERVGERFRIELPDASTAVAVDGEPARVSSPFDIASDPLALRLLLPPG